MIKDIKTEPQTVVAHQHLTLLELSDPADTQRVLKIPGLERLLVHQLSPFQLLFLPEAGTTLEDLLRRHNIPFTREET